MSWNKVEQEIYGCVEITGSTKNVLKTEVSFTQFLADS